MQAARHMHSATLLPLPERTGSQEVLVTGGHSNFADLYEFPDDDHDGVENALDKCRDVFNPGDSQEMDSDDDGIPDACDNCRYTSNPGQEDFDVDLLGDACDGPPETDIDNVIDLPTTPFILGTDFLVTATIYNNTDNDIVTFAPDCYNTYWAIPGAIPLCRRGPAYGIPGDLITIPAGGSKSVSCNLNEMFEPGSLPSGDNNLSVVYENYIQDPDYPLNPTACCTDLENLENCDCWFSWNGSILAKEVKINISATPGNKAEVGFNPDQWDPAWADGNSPPISVMIRNIASHTVYQVDVLSIRLNGTVPIIIGSEMIIGDALYVQFERAAATRSLGTIQAGRSSMPASVQGGFLVGNDKFSGTQLIDIVWNTGTLVVKADRHTVGIGPKPGSIKEPIEGLNVKLFDKSMGNCAAGYGISWQNYPEIYNNCIPVADKETDGYGKAIFSPAPGNYLVIGCDGCDKIENVDKIYIGNSVGEIITGDEVYKYLQIIKKSDGKKVPAKYRKFTGSELLVIEPEYVEWSEEAELYPFVFDSLGDWAVTTSVTPPEGFVADKDALSAEVSSDVEAVQFTITDIGSKWVATKVKHKIKHKNKTMTFESEVGMKLTPELAKKKGLGVYGEDDRRKVKDKK